MKILLYCPTYTMDDGKLAMCPETQDSINSLVVPAGVTLDIEVDTHNPIAIVGRAKEDHENTLMKYRKARVKMLDEGYNALLTVEHDMIIPEDALVKLLDTDADVVYGLYYFRHSDPVLNSLRSVRGKFPDMSMSMFPELIEKGKRNGVIECSGAGMGCTLIHRRVLEKLDFHRAKDGHPVPDMPFAADCMKNGFKQMARFDVPCGHITNDGKVLTPFVRGGNGVSENVKIYVFRSFNANINGATRHFEEGAEAEIPGNYADEFVRAGFITVRYKPAVKIVNKPVSKAKKSVKKDKPERDEHGRFVSKED